MPIETKVETEIVETTQETIVTDPIEIIYSPTDEYPVATEVWNFLTNTLGYSEYVAAGIVGNMMSECGGYTLDLKWNIYDEQGHYYGLCQWYDLYNISVQWASLEDQLIYLADTIEYEFEQFGYLYYTGFTYQDFLMASTPEDAALMFATVYERCGSYHYYPRPQNARIAFDYFVNY